MNGLPTMVSGSGMSPGVISSFELRTQPCKVSLSIPILR